MSAGDGEEKAAEDLLELSDNSLAVPTFEFEGGDVTGGKLSVEACTGSSKAEGCEVLCNHVQSLKLPVSESEDSVQLFDIQQGSAGM